MKISSLRIKNFKSILDLQLNEIDYACILVGKNNTGKTVALDAIRAVVGQYRVEKKDFNLPRKPIEVKLGLEFTKEDLKILFDRAEVSRLRNYEEWERDFCRKLPSYKDGILTFTWVMYENGIYQFSDGFEKSNPYIPAVLPKVYYIDSKRNLEDIEKDFLYVQIDAEQIVSLENDRCMFDEGKPCNDCFACVEELNKKRPEELTVCELARLMEYKLYHVNMKDFAESVNRCYHRNGGKNQDIQYKFNFSFDRVFRIDTVLHNRDRERDENIHEASAGTRSIYILSLLEAYISAESSLPSIIMIEAPEIYLHPQLQKAAGEILYRLSKKNQVIFSTHSPNMIFNFSGRQIKQVCLDNNYNTVAREDVEINQILDDLGYAANDLMNVSFVFIVEGKQDRSRLPLLLEKYYKEIYDEEGKLRRISIITTNSCTNIKTYANLKYMNQLYLKDQFLMIRDSDGKKPEYLVKQLCNYYSNREAEDKGYIPRVTPKNVLVLRYYSFENYFLDPAVMARIGVVKNEDEFYNILYQKYKDYLYRLSSVKRMQRVIGKRISTKQDIIENMESFRIFVRGHNLYDIFYGRYRGEDETEILRQYIEEAPRECFKDILDAIDRFVYFENRKKRE